MRNEKNVVCVHVGKGDFKANIKPASYERKTDKCAYIHILNINKIKRQTLNRKTFGDI